MNDQCRTIGAGIETLESRTFLSAAPIHEATTHAVKPAVRTKLVIPNLNGIAYQGSLSYKGSVFESFGITGSAETKGGALKLLLYIGGGESSTTYHVAGVVTLKDKLNLTGHIGKTILTVTGAVTSDLSSISGRLGAHAGRVHEAYTFSVTRVTATT